jgi:hypothetical protein
MASNILYTIYLYCMLSSRPPRTNRPSQHRNSGDCRENRIQSAARSWEGETPPPETFGEFMSEGESRKSSQRQQDLPDFLIDALPALHSNLPLQLVLLRKPFLWCSAAGCDQRCSLLPDFRSISVSELF